MAVVLILTNSNDGDHTDVVIQKICEQNSSVIRFDSDEITSGSHTLEFSSSGDIFLHTKSQTYNLLGSSSVWLRRPKLHNFPINNAAQRVHAESEFNALIYAICEILSNRKWLNTVWAIERAKLKIFQLDLARRQGLLVPDSLITSDPDQAREFCKQGQTVFKPIANPNIGSGDRTLLIPTTLLTDAHLDQLELIRIQSVLLQRYVEKKYELRITYVDGEFFVAKQVPTVSSSQTPADWRILQIDGKSTYEPYQLSKAIESKITGMMRKLCLNFATLDFAIDHLGRHFFLEVNPNGQWFGYTDEIGLPASSAIAKFLTTH